MIPTVLVICPLTFSGKEFSVTLRSFENLFIITPEGVTSKYVFTGAWHTLFIIFLNSVTPTDRLNPICNIHETKVITVKTIVV